MQVSSPLSQAAAFLTSRNATAISQKEDDAKKNVVATRDYQDDILKNIAQSGAKDPIRGNNLDVTA